MGLKKRADGKFNTGRPTVMTDVVVGKLEQAFSLGCSDTEACLFADISRDALYEYQKKHPDFADRKALLKDKLILKARTVIAGALQDNDKDTAKWYLERKAKDEFSTKIENDINAKGFTIQVADEKAKEELEDL